jgi:hypothetical protein
MAQIKKLGSDSSQQNHGGYWSQQQNQPLAGATTKHPNAVQKQQKAGA